MVTTMGIRRTEYIHNTGGSQVLAVAYAGLVPQKRRALARTVPDHHRRHGDVCVAEALAQLNSPAAGVQRPLGYDAGGVTRAFFASRTVTFACRATEQDAASGRSKSNCRTAESRGGGLDRRRDRSLIGLAR